MTARATFDFTGTQTLITGGTSGIGHATALGRVGTAAEIAATIAFLCTEQSSYTSGALFVVDGGSTSQ